MPRIGLFLRLGQEADRAAIGVRCRLAIDGFETEKVPVFVR